MLGYKAKAFKTHTEVSLEDLVPQDNIYRHVEAVLDLSIVRDLVRDCYSSSMGRPSLNLAHRWFIGYDLDEAVPNHSSLTRIRKRYGLETFQRFFEHIVQLCIEAGLVWGEELYFDGTRVEANADIDGLVPRFYFEAKQHLQELFGEERLAEERTDVQPERALSGELPITSRSLIGKYDGTRITARKKHWYKRWTDAWVSPTDPDATPMKRFTGDRAVLGYHTHYVTT